MAAEKHRPSELKLVNTNKSNIALDILSPSLPPLNKDMILTVKILEQIKLKQKSLIANLNKEEKPAEEDDYDDNEANELNDTISEPLSGEIKKLKRKFVPKPLDIKRKMVEMPAKTAGPEYISQKHGNLSLGANPMGELRGIPDPRSGGFYTGVLQHPGSFSKDFRHSGLHTGDGRSFSVRTIRRPQDLNYTDPRANSYSAMLNDGRPLSIDSRPIFNSGNVQYRPDFTHHRVRSGDFKPIDFNASKNSRQDYPYRQEIFKHDGSRMGHSNSVTDVFKGDYVQAAPLTAQPLSAQHKNYDDDKAPVTDEEIREMKRKYTEGHNENTSNINLLKNGEIFGSINLMNESVFKFKIFKKPNTQLAFKGDQSGLEKNPMESDKAVESSAQPESGSNEVTNEITEKADNTPVNATDNNPVENINTPTELDLEKQSLDWLNIEKEKFLKICSTTWDQFVKQKRAE